MHDHEGNVIPVPTERNFAYQNETTYPGCYIMSYPSERYNAEEAKKYSMYELIVRKHTDTAFLVELRKHRRDIVEQRKANGAAIEYETYQTILSFADFVNRIFAPGCTVYEEIEAFPIEIREAMKNAYDVRNV